MKLYTIEQIRAVSDELYLNVLRMQTSVLMWKYRVLP